MLKLNLKTNTSDYKIYIEKGLIERIDVKIKEIFSGEKIFVITDTNVEHLYADKIINKLNESGFKVYKKVLEAGENSKKIDNIIEIYSSLSDKSITRSDLIIGIGGGVVGDVSGFIASTYLRGVSFVQIPTTLLAQVDSSVGGKTAVDTDFGKNMVGSFYHPKMVIIDPKVLLTLSERVFRDGMAEVIKYAFIRSEKLYELLNKFKNREEIYPHIEDVIYECCSIKKEIVQRDEFDNGERMILNFGHTIGHAIETFYSYEKYTHGEAVSIGMNRIASLAAGKKIISNKIKEQIEELTTQYGLPVDDENIVSKELLKYIKNDKKARGSEINIVLVDKIGSSKILKEDISFFKNK
ncbi:3-dehydroquinate synthase [Peptostreptococcus faecalis]|uniref:3-dehydroquinate synthase n=1 Tax=Peptostreptococcus faecalis TaxID=2045015 RepID=UPI000C7B675C|nr:3-dehydroquinate synthase [Peptostreptococcus faecalis]